MHVQQTLYAQYHGSLPQAHRTRSGHELPKAWLKPWALAGHARSGTQFIFASSWIAHLRAVRSLDCPGLQHSSVSRKRPPLRSAIRQCLGPHRSAAKVIVFGQHKLEGFSQVFHEAVGNILLWLATLALACVCAVAAFAEDNLDVASVDAAWGFIKRNYYDQTFNGQDWESLHERYLARAKRGEGAANLTREMVSSLGDRYSKVVDAQTFERLMAYDPLGIGIVLTRNEEREVVVSNPPFPNSSAARAGIQQGDVVISIDGIMFSEESMLTVMDRVVQGDSAVVNLSLRRGAAANPLRSWNESFSRSRAPAPQGRIDTGIIAGNRPEGHLVGYVRFRSFTARSAIDMADAVAKLRAKGVDEFVLDLRGNLGGSFPAALEIAALFLQPDTVATRVQTPAVQDAPLKVSSIAGVAAREPLVVLVDQQSASASEVLAAALRGNCRASLLGAKTYGKAKVQGVFGLPNKEAITLTVARYSGPNGQAIGDGLQPDGPGPAGPIARVAAAIGLPTDLSPADYASIDFATERQQALETCKP